MLTVRCRDIAQRDQKCVLFKVKRYSNVLPLRNKLSADDRSLNKDRRFLFISLQGQLLAGGYILPGTWL